jgi:hypothetical protein
MNRVCFSNLKYNHNRKLPEYIGYLPKWYWLPRTRPQNGIPGDRQISAQRAELPGNLRPIPPGSKSRNPSKIRHLYVFFMNSSVSVYAVAHMLEWTTHRLPAAREAGVPGSGSVCCYVSQNRQNSPGPAWFSGRNSGRSPKGGQNYGRLPLLLQACGTPCKGACPLDVCGVGVVSE